MVNGLEGAVGARPFCQAIGRGLCDEGEIATLVHIHHIRDRLMHYSLDVDLPPGVHPEGEDKKVQQLVVTYLQLRLRNRAKARRQLVEMLAGDAPLTPADIQQARLEAKAHREVARGAQWLTAAQIAELANLGQGNPAATVNRWKQQRRMFAIRRDGRDYFPRYALGPDFRPARAVAEVMKVLSHYDADGLAGWFESTSSFLGGKRPREVLAKDPDRVIECAQNTLEAEQYAG